jgi:anaphase-promoting complex subunit 6
MVSSQPNMERFLRDWRQDALNKAQYDSAIFIGDKLLAMTSMQPCHMGTSIHCSPR